MPPEIPEERPSPDKLLHWSKVDDWAGTEVGWGGADGQVPQPGIDIFLIKTMELVKTIY